MAKKDGSSRRLAFEIAVVQRVKELCEEEGLDGPLGDFGLSNLGLPDIGIHPETLGPWEHVMVDRVRTMGQTDP
jgi:hypothetical protein